MSNSSGRSVAAKQLLLPFIPTEDEFRQSLQRLVGQQLAITLTDNSTSMLSARNAKGCLSLRIHRTFLNADKNVINAVADFIKGGKSGSSVIRSFIRHRQTQLNIPPVRAVCPRTKGEHHCLETIFTSVNARYFQGSVTASVTWGRKTSGKRVRRLTLGSFCRQSNTIRINPMFDRKAVPVYFLEFIMYHEMLHAALGAETKNGRRSVHSMEFRTKEKQFSEYEKARAWEKQFFCPAQHA
jgi:hypothetical protein